MNSPSTCTANSIMLPVPARLTTTSFIAWVAKSSRPARRTRAASISRSSVTKSPSSTAESVSATWSAGMSVRKPRRPRFTPMSGTPCAAISRAHDRSVPSPPTTTARSQRAGRSASGSASSGGVREASAVRVSMSTAARCARSTATTWSSFSGRTGASLFPTIATVLKGGRMGPN